MTPKVAATYPDALANCERFPNPGSARISTPEDRPEWCGIFKVTESPKCQLRGTTARTMGSRDQIFNMRREFVAYGDSYVGVINQTINGSDRLGWINPFKVFPSGNGRYAHMRHTEGGSIDVLAEDGDTNRVHYVVEEFMISTPRTNLENFLRIAQLAEKETATQKKKYLAVLASTLMALRMSFATPNPALEHQINLTRISLRRSNRVIATHVNDLNVPVYNQRQPRIFFPENFARMQISPNMNNDAQRQFKSLFWMMQAAAGGQQCYSMYQTIARISRNGEFHRMGVLKSKEEIAQVLSDVASMSCDLQILNPLAIDEDD